MGAYVTIDSLDAGRRWHTKPPGLGRMSEFGCIPPGEDHRGMGRVGCLPPGEDPEGLGFIAAIATIAGAAIQAGGVVGSAMISADAQKYAVRQQTKSELQIALARAKSELEMTRATATAQVEISKETTKQRKVEVEASTQQTRDVTTSLVPIVGILGAGALVAWVMLKD